MKQKLLFLLTALCFGVISGVKADVTVPDPVYFNDFSSSDGLTVHGNGVFEDDADARFGKIFHNDPNNNSNAVRTNYLQLPSTVFKDFTTNGGKTAMTIGLWVNKKNENDFFWTSLFAARLHGKDDAQYGTNDNYPTLTLETRCIVDWNYDNCQSDYWVADTRGIEGATAHSGGTYATTAWLDDGQWHYYTMTLTGTAVKVYVDGIVKDSWTLDGTAGKNLSKLFTNASELTNVTIGGNQAYWWNDPDPAFGLDDIAVYDEALSAEQIEKIIETKLGYTTVTYDFTSYTARTLANSGTKAFSGNSVNHNYASNLSEVFNRFSFQFAGTFSIEAAGLYAQRTNGDHVGISGLNAGDKVTINFSQGAVMVRGAVPTWAGITNAWTEYTSGTEIKATVGGNFSFQAKTSCKISSIVIKTTATETMTAPAISSEASGSTRTVTITDGASSLLSGVSTYYTTDGSIPTASSTKYTAPFEITETTTIKAITISNSSAETTSPVTEELIDMDAVDIPTASITAVDGVSRTVTFACTTDGATLSYSTNNGESYTEGTSLVISENTYIKVKATKGLATAESENTLFEAGAAITLNAPTYVIGAYSDGNYTLTLNTNQSDKLLSPNAAITYRINGGSTTNVASGSNIAVATGSTLEAWSVADGYSNSSIMSVTPSYIDLSEYHLCWSTDFKNVAMSLVTGTSDNLSLTKGDELIPGYLQITDEGFNSNFGVNNADWKVRKQGSGKDYNTGLWPYNLNGCTMAIANLPAGSVIVFTASGAITAKANATKDEFMSTTNSNYTFTVPAAGSAEFYPTKSTYIYSAAVYLPTVTASLGTNGYATFASPYALDLANLPSGLTAYKAAVDGNTVRFTQVTETVQANTGLLLKGTASETYSIPVAASGSDISATNAFLVNTNGIDVESGYTYYGLLKNTLTFATFDPASVTIPSDKAYLKVSDGEGARLAIAFEDDATGINAIKAAEAEAQKDGKYLEGGKIVIVKNGVKYSTNGQILK